jgi:TolB-like protein
MKLTNCKALLILVVALNGCTSMDDVPVAETKKTNSTGVNVVDIATVEQPVVAVDDDEVDNFGALGQAPMYSSVQGAYKGRPLTKHIGDYVKNLTQDLIANMEYVNNKTPVGVTNFSLLDSDLQQTDLLGQQMAESFVHELHKFRIPVIDYKVTDYIRVTEAGDFILSRDYLDLDSDLSMEYVLTGTMAKHQGGVMVNARIVGIHSHAVVASAQMLIPFYVVDALIPSDGSERGRMRDGVKISRG